MERGPYAEFNDMLERSFLRATRNAMLEAKRNGHSTPIMRDGKLIHLPPEEILGDEAAGEGV